VLLGSTLSLLQIVGATAIVLAAFGVERDATTINSLPG
jgi:hypothetical protein